MSKLGQWLNERVTIYKPAPVRAYKHALFAPPPLQIILDGRWRATDPVIEVRRQQRVAMLKPVAVKRMKTTPPRAATVQQATRKPMRLRAPMLVTAPDGATGEAC